MANFFRPTSRTGILAASLLLLTSNVAAQTTIEVQSGDSLWSLARKHGVSVSAIQEANAMGATEQIRSGQTLRIPAKANESDKRGATTASGPESPGTLVVADTPRPVKPKEPPPENSVVQASPFDPPSDRTRQQAEVLYSKGTPVAAANTLSERPPGWVLADPGPETQGEKPSAARGGVFPCAAPDPGFAHYAKWVQVAPMAHVLAPPAAPNLGTVRPDGSFDVVFHFHGREPLRKEWVRAMEGTESDAVLVAVDIGIASEPYRETFRDPRTFSQVLLAVEAELQRRSGNPRAFAQNITLSSWSAGYGAVGQLLSQPIPQARVGSVVLLDGLHAGFHESTLGEDRMKPFVQFAKLAATGSRLMFVSHSSIRTPGYASTTQTARYLVWKLGGRPQTVPATASDPMGLDRYSAFTQGNFHVRGFAGTGASDHCAHLGLMRDVLAVHLKPFWQQTRAGTPGSTAIAQRAQ